jgi:chromosome segregation ATPase
MKCICVLSLLTLAAASSQLDSNPLAAAITLMDELNAKLVADGVAEDKAFHKYMEWCDETTQNQRFAIKTLTTKKAELEASIEKASADIEAATADIEELAGKIAKAETEVKDATLIREKEEKEFLKAEAELEETLSALTRAIEIISKEMAKNPAAFLQTDTSSMNSLVAALGAIVDAASLTAADSKRLVAFAQQAGEQEDDAPDGAPAAYAYKSHSKGILDTLEDLKTKAEEQLATLRKEESNAKQNYNLLKGSLDDEIAYNSKEKKDTEAFKSETEEQKATDTGDLATTTKTLKETEDALATTQEDCMKTASDHDSSVVSRGQELKAVASAKKVLMETTSGASEETYSFLQRASTHSKTAAQLKGEEVANFVKRLAQKQHSEALSQLASRISALMQYGAANGNDPFVKVKGLIRDMIAKLEAEAEAAATEKAYCDEQMAKTEAKKSELEDDIAKLTAKIDTKSAASAKLKEEVKELQITLANLAKEQAEMDEVRAEQKAAYDKAKADLELGLGGVQKAISILRKYYQGEGAELLQQPAKPVFHAKAEGAGGSIIDILEVVESQFAKTLSEEESTEADAVETYEKRTQEIKVQTAEDQQSVKYKVQEFKGLDKEVAELSADRKSTNEELAAVLEYYAKVKDRCIAKPETYEERAARREAEIAGLKEALSILNDETAFIQVRKRSLRSTVLSA